MHNRTVATLLLVALGVARAPTGGLAAPPATGAEAASAGDGTPGASGPALIERVEWIGSSQGAQLVVRARGFARYSTHFARADQAAGLPHRAFVDLRPARLSPGLARAPMVIEDPLVKRVRVGQFDRDTVRIVVDLAEPAQLQARAAHRPERLMLTVHRSAEAAPTPSPIAVMALEPSPPPMAEAPPPHTVDLLPSAVAEPAPSPVTMAGPEPTRAAGPSPALAVPSPVAVAGLQATPSITAKQRRASRGRLAGTRRFTVVLDPGHGGKDPGARGINGDEEKSITLQVAELVSERLNGDPNLRIALTRTDDSFVSLEQRTAIANAQGADLFVSIHANASENRDLTGIETYTLNNTDDRATIRLAALENGLTLAGGSTAERDLAYILSDLVQTGKEDESIALARAVHGELFGYLHSRWRDVASLGVKKGPFYVLVGAYMPCVLVEVAFLTHHREGPRIVTPRYQQDVAEGIARGIRRFLSTPVPGSNL